MIDGGSDIDLDAVIQNVREADVVCLYFPALGQTLLVDMRTAPGVEAMVCVVPMVDGPDERVRSLRRLRPQLPRPLSITMIPWTLRARSLVRCGVWAQLLARLDDVATAQRCLRQLHAQELAELGRAIAGRDYEAIWSRTDTQRETGAS